MTGLETFRDWLSDKLFVEDDDIIEIANVSEFKGKELCKVRTKRKQFVIDINKKFKLHLSGVSQEDILNDILLELRGDESLTDEEYAKTHDRDWLLRNITLNVMPKNLLLKDPIYQEIGNTDLVLTPAFMSNNLCALSTAHLSNYRITENEMFSTAKRNLLATVDDMEICVDGSIKVDDTVAFIPEYVDKYFGNKPLYIVANNRENVRVYTEKQGKNLDREGLELSSLFCKTRKLTSGIIVYKNGKYEKESVNGI